MINLNFKVSLLGQPTDIIAGKVLAKEMMMLTGMDWQSAQKIAELAEKINGEDSFELSREEMESLGNLVSNLTGLPVFVKVSIFGYLQSIA